MTDEFYMKLALEQAQKGYGWVNPNPMVGAVVVKNSEVIGAGYHERYGGLHAERNALAHCMTSPQGGTLYVTLEPCCHYGKTPPCTQAILESGIKRVVIGSTDPNPLVSGKGIKTLLEHGIMVQTDVLSRECKALNIVFFHYIRTKRPYVVMKYAMTMDGKITTASGQSKWITGEAARHHVQEDRHRYAGIMVGVNTVLQDDPQLTCRLENGNSPVRIVCDSSLRTPIFSQIVRTASEVPTILATCSADKVLAKPYLDAGCEVLVLPQKEGSVDLHALMEALGEKGIDSVLLEGGGKLNWSAIKCGIVNKVQAYIAPKVFGGEDARTPISGLGVSFLADAIRLNQPRVTLLGEDILLESEVV